MGKTTKLTMYDATYSPVSGCVHGCEYCYARCIANRFAGYDKEDESNRRKFSVTGYKGTNIYTVEEQMTKKTKSGNKFPAVYPFGFAPTLHKNKLKEPYFWKQSKDIFVCSMADLFGKCIPDIWIAKVFDVCQKAPQHRYFFLTKYPQRYIELFEHGLVPENHDNFWFGTTVPTPDVQYFFRQDANCFLSIEPIHSDFPVDERNLKELGIKWMIVGAETGNRKEKVIPECGWVEHIAETCKLSGIPLYMKESLETLMGDDFVQEKP